METDQETTVKVQPKITPPPRQIINQSARPNVERQCGFNLQAYLAAKEKFE